MPIVTIQCVDSGLDKAFAPGSVERLADRLGELFESEPGTTWVSLSWLDFTQYAENKTSRDNTAHPTFVEILKRALPEENALAIEAEHVARCVADILNRPIDNVHVIYVPEGAGRIAFGGKLIHRNL